MIDGIDIEVPIGHEISGTITAGGLPLAGAQVTACDPGEVCPRVATTAGDGTYTIVGLESGQFFLTVTPPEDSDAFDGWYTSSGPVDDFENGEAVDATAGDVSGVDLDLVVGHHISGTVLGSGTVALEGVQVVALGPAGGAGAVTDATGAFVVHALADGSYTLDIGVPSTLNYVSGVVVDGAVEPPSEDGSVLELAGADVAGIAIEPAAGRRMTGTLTGSGASGARVTAIGTQTSVQATLAANGHWEIGGLWPDSYQLLFEPASEGGIESLFPLGWWSGGPALTSNEAAAATVVVTSADRTGLNAAIPDGIALSGTVVADDGATLDDAYVFACADGVGCVSILTDESGAWAFDHAKPGAYVIQASHPEHVGGYFGPGGFAVTEPLATSVVVGSADRPGVNIVLPTGSFISGTITDGPSSPVEGARVRAVGDDGISPASSGADTSGADGTYLVPGLDPDEYLISVQFEPDSPHIDGYYAAGADGNFTTDFNDATAVVVGAQGDGSSYVPITPTRVADSRAPLGLSGILTANVPQTFEVGGFGDIPLEAVAVTGNVTVVGQTAAGYVSVTPTPTANPSSSTINVPLGDVRANNFTSPLADDGSLAVVYKALAGKKSRVVVDTYQAVSGTGADAIAEFESQIRAHVAGEPKSASVYPHPIAFNALPQVDVFLENGYTKEEWKVVTESRKILHLPELRITSTAVRVPVFVAHSEAVHVETRDPITPDRARELFADVDGVVIQDDPGRSLYPLASEAAGSDDIFVGRVRTDPSIPDGRGIAFWVVSDNLRKGAATNAVQIAEALVERGWVRSATERGATAYRSDAGEPVGAASGGTA